MILSVLAYVSDVTSTNTRAKGMGYLSAAMNLGMVLGQGIGGIIANFGIRVPYFFAAALGFASTLLTLILPKTLPKGIIDNVIATGKDSSNVMWYERK